jgi:hypothetical protein
LCGVGEGGRKGKGNRVETGSVGGGRCGWYGVVLDGIWWVGEWVFCKGYLCRGVTGKRNETDSRERGRKSTYESGESGGITKCDIERWHRMRQRFVIEWTGSTQREEERRRRRRAAERSGGEERRRGR